MTNLLGQSLGRYHILEQLGEGGMATVYKAYDTRLETDVAVKVIRTENILPSALERTLKRFEREAKALARLTHANIVKVTDYGDFEGRPYLVMEYLPSGTLKSRLGQPIPWSEAVRLILPIGRALAYAHEQGMIHRDVKPANILITHSGDPMLTDFGIAKIIDEESTMDLTGASAAVGTPEYMAPEQVTAKNVDARADIYALGVVLYEMVTGRKPYTADTPMAVLFKHASEPLPRPKNFAPSLPDAAEKILLKALAKKPEDRYQRMDDLVAALEANLGAASAPVRAQTSRPRERAFDTNATMMQEGTTLRDTPAPPQRFAQSSNPAPAPTWKRYWPLALLAVVCLLGVIFLSANGARLSAALFATKTPVNTPTPTFTLTPIFTATPSATPNPNEITDAKGVVMRLVPAGEFTMGSETYSDENPIHQVYLDAFYIDKYEVTNALYEACVNAGVCDPPHETSSYTHSSYYGNSQYDDYPVINVEWNQANTFCEWRGARLPSEAEWEKAARGTDGRIYPWGDTFDGAKLNFCDKNCSFDWADKNADDGYADIAPVGSYENGKSPYGLYDMAGNVWEWVSDWYDSNYYSQSPSRNPQGPASGEYHVLRGGSWYYFDVIVRSAGRYYGHPDDFGVNHDVGFRCARSLP